MRTEMLESVLLIFLTLVYQFRVIHGHFSSSRLFSRSIEGFQKLRTFTGVSIATCEKKCRRRQRCQGLIYNRRAAVCVLTSMLPTDQTVIDNIGMVLVTDFDRANKSIQKCAQTECAWEETCLANEQEDTCKVTECGPPPSIYTSFHGNMYAVDNTIAVNWDSSLNSITCGPDGFWKSNNSQCLPGWRQFENSCYYLDPQPRTQEDARVFCETVIRSAHLIDVKSAAENKFMKDWINILLKEYGGATNSVWLGGTYDTATGQYYWSDGTAFDDTYQCWGPGEPNNLEEECVMAWSRYYYAWNDASCFISASSMCEFEKP